MAGRTKVNLFSLIASPSTELTINARSGIHLAIKTLSCSVSVAKIRIGPNVSEHAKVGLIIKGPSRW